MPAFVRGQTIQTTTPYIAVSAGMSVGTYAWRLEVIDAAGNVSAPAYVNVTIYSTIYTKPWLEAEPEPLPAPPKPPLEEM
jgi:hypothetical protein